MADSKVQIPWEKFYERRQRNFREPAAHRRIVYGEQKLSGPILFFETRGSTNDDAWLWVALAGHEVAEIGDVWLDDEVVSLTVNGSDPNRYSSQSGRFSGLVELQKFLGTDDQTVPAWITSELSGQWVNYPQLGLTEDVRVRALTSDPWTVWDVGPPPASPSGDYRVYMFQVSAYYEEWRYNYPFTVTTEPSPSSRTFTPSAPTGVDDPQWSFFPDRPGSQTYEMRLAGAGHFERWQISYGLWGTYADFNSAGVIIGSWSAPQFLMGQSNTGSKVQFEISQVWTDKHRLRGIAGIMIKIDYDADQFDGNSVPEVKALVRGKKVRDFSISTVDPPIVSSRNPANCLADYLCDPVFGQGANWETDFDLTALQEAAQACNDPVNGTSDASRFRCDGAFESDEEPGKIIQALTSCMAGRSIFTAGQWIIHAGVWREPVLELSEQDLVSGVTLSTLSQRDLANGVKGTYLSPENDWTPYDFPAFTDSAALRDDNNERNWMEREYDFTTDEAVARRLAMIDLRTLRAADHAFEAEFSLKALQLRPGDNITFTYDRFGWDAKSFEVQAWRLIPPEDETGWRVGLALVATEQHVYGEDGFLIMEDGSGLLTEDGGHLALEDGYLYAEGYFLTEAGETLLTEDNTPLTLEFTNTDL
ncbi:phage tail protein [Cerasicoccus arenae]|uniref:Tip attachment protein J domain-containing protein n=1 Tax=Cerasicoccus arenae TaxID=424488 RepID=A0A8J3DFX6_9BACT|nr:phage tail protein [Cerasicoccus arenae]MBK1858251.1 hypothetical protein [Cerasicoccus arenae]GHC02171.1 hypothetical protein GCM10007047_18370 [Cerasicoccus arenae]